MGKKKKKEACIQLDSNRYQSYVALPVFGRKGKSDKLGILYLGTISKYIDLRMNQVVKWTNKWK